MKGCEKPTDANGTEAGVRLKDLPQHESDSGCPADSHASSVGSQNPKKEKGGKE